MDLLWGDVGAIPTCPLGDMLLFSGDDHRSDLAADLLGGGRVTGGLAGGLHRREGGRIAGGETEVLERGVRRDVETHFAQNGGGDDVRWRVERRAAARGRRRRGAAEVLVQRELSARRQRRRS